jgi:exodeoxyribonuclease VII small subunit
MAKDELSYEAAKSQLDEVVALLENKDIALDDMVKLWEQGEKLAAICEEKLAGAKSRLEALRPTTKLGEDQD